MDIGAIQLGRAVPVVILSGIGMLWSLALLIRKRNHIFRNLLLCITAAGLCCSNILLINLGVVIRRGSWGYDEELLHYRLSLAAQFFFYSSPSLLWCAAMDVFRTSIPQSEEKNNTSYRSTLIATYFAYLYTIAILVVGILVNVYLAPFQDNGILRTINAISAIGFWVFGQWAYPMLFLIQYYGSSSRKFVSTFSTSLWCLFGILLLITILNTVIIALGLSGTVSVSLGWVEWVANSIAASFAILYVCYVGPKWMGSHGYVGQLSQTPRTHVSVEEAVEG